MADATACATDLGGALLLKKKLGSTNIEVSQIGLGTVKFGRNQGVKYPSAFELPSDAEIVDLLSLSKDLGINLLDTAPAYGISEERLGVALNGMRHEWILSSKVGEEFVNGESHFAFSKAAVIKSVERSLQRLKTDYLDILLVHSDGQDERLIDEENIFETLALLKQAGKIRAYGMSTKTVAGGLRTLALSDIAMVTLNMTTTDEREVIQYAHQHNKGIFIKKALASGHLQHSVQDAMKFVLAEPGVSSVIIGTINPKHLREVCEV